MNVLKEIGIHAGLVVAALVFVVVSLVVGFLMVVVAFALFAWILGEQL